MMHALLYTLMQLLDSTLFRACFSQSHCLPSSASAWKSTCSSINVEMKK